MARGGISGVCCHFGDPSDPWGAAILTIFQIVGVRPWSDPKLCGSRRRSLVARAAAGYMDGEAFSHSWRVTASPAFAVVFDDPSDPWGAAVLSIFQIVGVRPWSDPKLCRSRRRRARNCNSAPYSVRRGPSCQPDCRPRERGNTLTAMALGTPCSIRHSPCRGARGRNPMFAVSAVLIGVLGIFIVRRRSARKKQGMA